jgi:hypothetical protein
MIEDAVFIRRGKAFAPTELARGPWDPDSQHGGAPAALIARELERIAGDGWQFARLDVQLLRPVPLVPLEVAAEVEREGRRARRLRAELRAGGDVLCTAQALQLRRGGEAMPEAPLPARPIEGPDAATAAPRPVGDLPMFGGDAVELRFVEGAFATPGPAAAWLRLRVPIVPGETPSPLQRTVAAADFGNGISSEMSWDEYLFVNPELTVYLLRDAVGEWIGLDSTTAIDAAGVGLAESTLRDVQGPIGRALQSLYVSTR